MSSLTDECFLRSLDRFRSQLSEDQKKEFAMTNIADVKNVIGKIQDRIGSEKKLRNLERLRGFLEGMKQVEELVTIFLNVHEVVAFVWGPIKLALLMASAHLKALEILIDTYEDIGTFIEGIRQLERLFRNYSSARQILERCFDDILRFHQVALEELTRPNWKRWADRLWPQIKNRFEPILKSLQNHRSILFDGKIGAAIEEIQDTRHMAQNIDTLIRTKFDEIKEIQQRQHSELLDVLQKDKGSILAKLDPPDYQGDHHNASTQRHDSDSGSWILEEPKFKQWANGTMQNDAVLYVNGMPGSGKTTLASTVIESFKSKAGLHSATVAFFYFKHHREQGNRNAMGAMLRAIVSQLLDQDDSLLGPLQHKCAALSKSDVIQEPLLKDIGKDCITLQRRCWIILDGLDECDQPGRDQAEQLKEVQVINWFLNGILPASPTDDCPVRVLFSAQRDGYIDQRLASYPSINLDTMESHVSEVKRFVDFKLSEIEMRFSLDGSTISSIDKQVSTTAKGMFLYAKVVLDNLLCQDSIAELKEELSSEHFPKGLDAAYERVVVRILDRPPTPRKRTAETILGWLVCSSRPLRWREIQSRFCINPEKEVCNYENRRLDNGKVLCGSLVEVDPCELYKNLASESVIRIVHETARSYLVRSERFPLGRAHADMALFCTRYLASKPFNPQYTTDEIEHSALSGYYGLLDYAVTSWKGHVKCATAFDNGVDGDTSNSVRCSVRRLMDTQMKGPESGQSGDETRNEMTADPSPTLSIDDLILKDNDRGFVLYDGQLALIRQVIEMIDHLTLPDDNPFSELNGYGRFKCSRPECAKFTSGFRTEKQRHYHVLDHEKPFKCSVEGCYAQTIGYNSQDGLNKHTNRLHSSQSAPEDLFPVSKNQEEETIWTAARTGDLEQLKYFHALGIPLDEPKPYQRGQKPPLVLASKNGHANICDYLVRQGADPFDSWFGISPLEHAVIREDITLVQLFFQTNTSKYKPKISPEEVPRLVAWAICGGNLAVSEYLLVELTSRGISLKSLFRNILWDMCYNPPEFPKAKSPEKRTFLLHMVTKKAFPRLYYPGDGAIRRQIPSTLVPPNDLEQDLQELHQLLIKEQGENTPLQHACLTNQYCVAEFLLDFLADDDIVTLNRDAMTAVHCLVASAGSRHNIVAEHFLGLLSRLLKAKSGRAANLKDNMGNLPIHLVVDWIDIDKDVIRVLIQHTTNLNEKNNSGHTALEVAVIEAHDVAVSLLIQSGRVDLSGESILTLARSQLNIKDRGICRSEKERRKIARERILRLLEDGMAERE